MIMKNNKNHVMGHEPMQLKKTHLIILAYKFQGNCLIDKFTITKVSLRKNNLSIRENKIFLVIFLLFYTEEKHLKDFNTTSN